MLSRSKNRILLLFTCSETVISCAQCPVQPAGIRHTSHLLAEQCQQAVVWVFRQLP